VKQEWESVGAVWDDAGPMSGNSLALLVLSPAAKPPGTVAGGCG